MKVLTNLTI